MATPACFKCTACNVTFNQIMCLMSTHKKSKHVQSSIITLTHTHKQTPANTCRTISRHPGTRSHTHMHAHFLNGNCKSLLANMTELLENEAHFAMIGVRHMQGKLWLRLCPHALWASWCMALASNVIMQVVFPSVLAGVMAQPQHGHCPLPWP